MTTDLIYELRDKIAELASDLEAQEQVAITWMNMANDASLRIEGLEDALKRHGWESIVDSKPHPDHCLCDDCVTPENMDERIRLSGELDTIT